MYQSSFYVHQPEKLTTENVDSLLKLTGAYSSKIQFSCHSQHANGKSMIGVLMLGIGRGTYLSVRADGEDEEQAVLGLAEYFGGEITMETVEDPDMDAPSTFS